MPETNKNINSPDLNSDEMTVEEMRDQELNGLTPVFKTLSLNVFERFGIV